MIFEKYIYAVLLRRQWHSLQNSGMDTAIEAMKSGFALAEKFRSWDPWSIDKHSILWIAELIVKQQIEKIVEFGSGYSTIALSKFITELNLKCEIHSFEHQNKYAQNVKKFLPSRNIYLYCTGLLQVEDHEFEEMFVYSDPIQKFRNFAKPLNWKYFHETRLRNVFYDFDFRDFENESVDLVIIDGPNGNGRSLAFPFLRNIVKPNFWLFVDDYLDYPFLKYFSRIYKGDILRHSEICGKEYVIVNVWGHRENILY